MSDVNIQTFSGKVNVTDNFKVGAGHLFVDTQDNKVGLNTATPTPVSTSTVMHMSPQISPSVVH